MVSWLAIEVVTSLQGAEQVHGLLDALGCMGTAQTFEPDGTVRVVGYLPATEDVAEKLVWLQEQIDFAIAHDWLPQSTSVTTRTLEAEEWEAPLREVLPPLPIGNRFLIVLTDESVDNPEHRIILRLRSLGGFGTGTSPDNKDVSGVFGTVSSQGQKSSGCRDWFWDSRYRFSEIGCKGGCGNRY